MSMIEKILQRPEFEEFPPVLVDIGASGGLHLAWKKLAKYSVCIAFDPDSREMEPTRRASKVYRKLHVFNRAVTNGKENAAEFYLTKSPACSSLFTPNAEALAAWEFADRFQVLKKEKVETMRVTTALDELGLDRVDWFKTDSQGGDLRLFLSLGEPLIRKVMVAEFEPGIIDAYCGEDKLGNLMTSMDTHGFWMSDVTIKGSTRMPRDGAGSLGHFERRYMVHLLKSSPGWGEVTYLNSLGRAESSHRDYLLGWVCASLLGQHGFAMELAVAAAKRFDDDIFEELKQNTIRRIRRSYFNLRAYFPLARRAMRKWKRQGIGKTVTQ
jgi:FkbM family methyltransferase